MSKDIVWKLLRRNISVPQMTGYALATLAGLSIILVALQFYRDVTSAKTGDDGFISQNYMIISKRVEGLGSLFGGDDNATRFSDEEIKEIQSQPWAEEADGFTAAAFNVSARVSMGGSNMSSALFLESIPDDYFDISPKGWNFNPARDNTVPIIISKDYLTLYNFGFASSRGMPQISEEMIGMIPLQLSLSGNGRQMTVNGRIVGFSSRLNTIAVPEEFMEWANGEFAGSAAEQPSRLIIKVAGAGGPEAEDFMADHGYEIAGDNAGSGRLAYFLKVLTTVVVGIGAIISILAFFILTLSIFLLLQKNSEKISTLMLIGYSPRQIAAYYYKIVASVNATVLILSVAVTLIASHSWQPSLERIGLTATSPLPTILAGTIVIALLTAGNFLAINRKVSGLFRG